MICFKSTYSLVILGFFMTFSIAGYCERTGMFGVAITTSSISVGSRCPHARAGVGAVATQNITDPNLANLVLNQMEPVSYTHLTLPTKA